MDPNLMAKVTQAASVLSRAEYLVAFSGAGMSAESGIPTFRDPGGLWDQFDPEEVGTGPGLLNALTEDPDRIRAFIDSTIEVFSKAKPNPGHLALGTLEHMGILQAVITQNIDNLHQEAGNKRVIEMHGNIYRQQCLSCNSTRMMAKDEFLGQVSQALGSLDSFDIHSIIEYLPQCECGSPMRPDVVMFGEQVLGVHEAFQEAEDCTAMLILGTSGVVYPAAALPQRAKDAGAFVIEINPGESVYRGLADIQIEDKTGVVLPSIVDKLLNA